MPQTGGGPVPSMATTNPDGTLLATGPITGFVDGGFTIQTGSSHGYVHVYTNASTAITGPAPFVNEQVQVNGTGSWSAGITASAVAQISSPTTGTPTPGPTATPLVALPTPNPALISTQGPITQLGTGRFQINSGYPHGYLYVYYNANTTFIGGTGPTLGKYVQVSGTGSLSATFNGTIVTLYSAAPGSVTANGTIVGSTNYGFTINSNGTTIPIVLNSSSVIAGGVLSAGSQASVTGTGSTSASITAVQAVITNPTPVPSPNATPTPTPGPIAQKHVLTSDYLGSPNGNGTVTPAQAAPYDTWAQTNIANANSVASAGIKVQMYVDPNREATTDPLYTSDDTTFAHDCSNNRIYDTYKNRVQQWVMNPASANMQSLFRSYVMSRIGSSHVDALFVDDAGPLSDFGLTSFTPGAPCNYTDDAWTQGEIALNNAAPVPVIFNGLNALNGHDVSLSTGMLAGSNTFGGNFEHCLTDDGIAKQNGWLWTAIENTQLQVTAKGKTFECESINTSPAATSQDARTYGYASFLLTYNPSLSIWWTMFATTSGLHALPETQLVPLDPVMPAPADVSGLVMSGGAYGREYKHCYVAGQFVSACAVVVNPSTAGSVINPFPQYTHTLTMNGSDVLDGGSIATNGPAAPMYIPALGSAIVFP